MRTAHLVKAAGIVGAVGAMAALSGAMAAPSSDPAPEMKFRAFVPAISREDAPATPAAAPAPYFGPVQTLYLGSANLTMNPVVEQRDTTYVGGREVFQDPTAPALVAWYPRFGHPGFVGHNSIFAAHVNYIGYGNGPFAHLTSAVAGDALYVTMANGDVYAYTVRSVEVVALAVLDMDAVVFPLMSPSTDRVTLISCGGTFVPNPTGGGEYNSRVILVAERFAP